MSIELPYHRTSVRWTILLSYKCPLDYLKQIFTAPSYHRTNVHWIIFSSDKCPLNHFIIVQVSIRLSYHRTGGLVGNSVEKATLSAVEWVLTKGEAVILKKYSSLKYSRSITFPSLWREWLVNGNFYSICSLFSIQYAACFIQYADHPLHFS